MPCILGLYIINWIYRYMMENYYDLIAIAAGVVQTVLYCDFFYLYVTKGENIEHKYESYPTLQFSPLIDFVLLLQS